MIQQAKPHDVGDIKRIAQAAYHAYVVRLGKPPAPMVADFAVHIDRDWVIVFEQDGHVRGYAILVTSGQGVLLDNIAVDPASQRSGIGDALVRAVERRAIELGHEALDLYTNVVMADNIRWYQKLGFSETKRIEEAGFRRVYMRKMLGTKDEARSDRSDP
ncbi:MAG: GNAT family N-acetyltransferase [Pseudomonadota bacterium]